MSTLGSAAPGKAGHSLKERIERLQRELANQRKKASRGAAMTAVFGVIILVALCGYFYFGYSQFVEITKPETVVGAAQTIVDENVPVVRKSIEEEIKRSAPVWAEGFSKQALGAIPNARERLETLVSDRVDTMIQERTMLTEEQFRAFLRNHKDGIRRDLKELGGNPQLAEASINTMTQALEKEVQADLESQSKEVFHALSMANAKLKRLRAGQQLSTDEQAERRMLMLARRLQFQQTGGREPTTAPPPTAAPATGEDAPPPITPGAAKAARERRKLDEAGDAKPVPAPKADEKAVPKPEKKDEAPAKPADAPKG